MNYSKTINLPSTNFSMKANLSTTEYNWIKFWDDNNIYEVLKKNSSKFKSYVLHDGPPYANGDLHLGHALNKILKDIICREKFQKKLNVDYRPGWDCHGLPIEWKIEEQFKKKGKEKNDVKLETFRKECRDFANHWVNEQKDQFKRFGLQTDWKEIYLTMNKDSEITIVRELLKFFESGDLYLGFKPVMWSVVEQTALAEAEIEYHDKISKSIFVKFPLKNKDKISIIIWTTTPWTIPCNKAIAYSSELEYLMVKINEDLPELNLKIGETLIISENLVENFIIEHGIKKYEVKNKISSNDLEDLVCMHPLKNKGFEFDVKIFPSSHVTDDTGTGFVHIAPNHGLEDFELGQKYDLGNNSTINSKGVYEKNIKSFQGIHVFKADNIVIKELHASGNLISAKDYNHSYPHSWRSGAPLIYRATSQWFISMEKNNLRNKTLNEIENVSWVPKNSKNRILSMIKDRPDWCISRQRNWGVPITIFLDKKTQEPLLDKEVNKKIISVLEEKGIDSWFCMKNDSFLTEKYNSEDFIKVNSILDVWFDSGTSHVYVLKNKGIEKADLYLEGSDQHRGWFQSSIVQSCGVYKKSPYKTVFTHGFVIDEKGKKMSKSLGNIISPKEVIDKYGADILRIWVASSNFSEDVRISYQNLDRHAESYRKIRNTLRFILGNINGWDGSKKVNYEDLPELEKFILYKIFNLNKEVNASFDEFNFSKAYQTILNFCNMELSSFFFDIRKDTLYCEDKDSIITNSTKTVMSHLFENLIKWLSPIIPFTTEEAWQSWRKEIDTKAELSCHFLKKNDLDNSWNDEKLGEIWIKIFEIRDAFLFFVEKKRNEKLIKSSMEVKPFFFFFNEEYKKLARLIDMSEILISSDFSIVENLDESFEEYPENKKIFVKIEKSNGQKCPRCWKIFEILNDNKEELCKRCSKVLNKSD
ncbi:MAG: isoleucine--tRNA ligase [Alphaproteobacteria bacterium]